jgi:hypothetical protein
LAQFIEVGEGTDMILPFVDVCDELIADAEVVDGETVGSGSGNDVECSVVLLAEVITAMVCVTAAGIYGSHSVGIFCKA